MAGSRTLNQIKEDLSKTTIKDRNISKELETSFLEYAMSVIVARALPDARDGFKPVHRRVLYAAYGLGMTSDRPHKKSARLVGEVIGKYHPHGDTAAYETMVRMAQDFSMRYMLIDGHGNFGSVDGDSAAAMRYTEARLSKIGDVMMMDIDKDTVNFMDNYDGSEREPEVLPTLFPNLLANGSSGIAVGMATNIPPHNLSEIVAAVKLVAHNKDVSFEEIMTVLKGPDFPTYGTIIGASGIDSYFRTGRGSITIRAKHTYTTADNGKSTIIVSELPYIVNKKTLIDRITELVKLGNIDGIANIYDESNRDGMRLIIETKRDVIPEVLMNQLYKSTALQTNFSVNMLALVGGEPKLLNVKEVLEIYLAHQLDVLTRRISFELKKAAEREHILRGLHIATGNIDEIIKLIRGSSDNDEALADLMRRFKLSEIQAKAILDMRLKSLSNMERAKIEEELATTEKTIIDYKDILNKNERKIAIIETELDKLVKKFGDERRTLIELSASADIDDEDLIPVEDIIVTMSSRGYLKRMPIDTYRVQKRGGVGVIGLQTHNDDDVEKIIATSTHTDLLFFTNEGKVYRIRGHQVPLGSRQSKGIPAINVINIEKTERILSILPVDDYQNACLFFATVNGITKKTLLTEFERINKSGKIAISLKDNDKLFKVVKVHEGQEVYIGASNGNMVRFVETQVRPMGRNAAGVHGINLGGKDTVVGLSTSLEGKLILSVGTRGVGKMTPTEEYRLTKRNAKGVRTLKITPKTGKLIFVSAVNGDEDALMITTTGKVIRFSLQQVNCIGRSTSGVKLMNVEENERIQSIAIFKPENLADDATAPIDTSAIENEEQLKGEAQD
ncbi:MAG: DNA topoisomerase (ATP-hydrolyzing) subunit A [Mycoplasmataceae bacterium]|jgi:DNA gyrase subunit A|nr:DNA topoisomerase (ATP-hydrolyzing) subunit A [Mycoplasmataceae bacterium]